jgi:hypothetical protein
LGLEDEKRKLLGDSIKALLRYLQKYISPFQALFFPGKRFDLRNRCWQKNVLEYNHGLTSLLDFVFSVNPSILETIEI